VPVRDIRVFYLYFSIVNLWQQQWAERRKTLFGVQKCQLVKKNGIITTTSEVHFL
jgi:hypothetical protein